MHVSAPPEAFPELGTVANPAVLFDGHNAFICYEASVRSGGGNVVLRFADVIDFRIAPVTVEGLKGYRYSVNPWAINEVIGAQEADAWKVLNPRLWLISFNDLMIEVLFETVSLIAHDPAGGPQNKTLIGFCGNMV